MIRVARALVVAVALPLGLSLGACSSFDPTNVLDFISQKKKLPGERQPVFPEGTPGVGQGVPPELVKGYQAPVEEAAAPPPEEPKPKPKAVAKPKPAPKPTRLAVPAGNPTPVTVRPSNAPQPVQQQQDASPWPEPPRQQQPQIQWPDPPPPSAFPR